VSAIGLDIVSTFRKTSTKPDQAQPCRTRGTISLVILSRNLTVAFAVVVVLLVISGHTVWAIAWGAAALAFWRQHKRFANTESNAVFGAAFVVMVTAPTAPSPAGPPDDPVTAGQDGER
jgi:hypothetical protein